MAEQGPEVKMMMDEPKEMKQWRMEITNYLKKRYRPAAAEINIPGDDEDTEVDHTNDIVEFGRASHLNGAQAKATQPGVASLVSVFAVPHYGPDSKPGKGWGAISRGTTDPRHTKCAADSQCHKAMVGSHS